MTTEKELSKLKVDELKKKCQDLNVSTEGKKADLIQRILEAEAAGGDAGDVGAPEEEHMEEEEELEDHAPPPVAGEAAQQQAPASKHAKIVFGAAEPGKKVIELQKPSAVGTGDVQKVVEMSAEERARIRAERFSKDAEAAKAAGLLPKEAVKAPPVVLSKGEEEYKTLVRKQRFGKLSDSEQRRFNQLQMSHDKKDLMDPEKLKAREAKFGKGLLKVGGGKEPITSAEALEKRAKRFGVSTKPTGDDEARKKARLERFKG